MTSRPLSDPHLEAIAERAAQGAAERVVERMWINLGVDINNADSVSRLTGNMAYLDRVRRSSEQFGDNARKAAWAVLVSVIGAIGIAIYQWAATRIGFGGHS